MVLVYLASLWIAPRISLQWTNSEKFPYKTSLVIINTNDLSTDQMCVAFVIPPGSHTKLEAATNVSDMNFAYDKRR